MSGNTLQKTIYLNATKAEVWAFLTEPEKMAQWFHAPKAPVTEGQPFEVFGAESGDKMIWGDVTKATPHDYLEYTFTIAPMGGAMSTVKWTLEDVPGGTRLSLIHEGLPGAAEAFGLTLALDHGWDKHLMQMRDGLHGEG